MKAKCLLLICASVAALIVSGCGKPATGPAPVRISLFTWTKPEELRVNQQLVAEFMRLHPNIKVELINEPSRRAMDKLQAMIAARNAPDVMSIHGAYFIPFADKGALLDLHPYVSRADFDLADFYPQLVELCRWHGKLYSLPRYTSVYVLFYNRDLFDAAGLKYPDDSWTWDTYLQATRKLTRPGADAGSQQFGCLIQFWGARLYPWLWANGGDLLSADRKHCTINSPECRQALQFLVDLRYKYQVTPATSAANPDQDLAMFTAGKIGMMMTGAWDIQMMHSAPGLHWDVAPLPKKKSRASLLGMENYAVSSTTRHPEEAWQLFSFLLSKQAQTVMAEKLEKQPSRQSVANASYVTATTSYNRRVFVEALAYAHIAPNVPNWERIKPLIDQPLDRLWLGQTTVPKATDDIVREVDKLLAKQ